MQNYYAYFTEVEERFQRRRGTLTMLSTLDWALIDTWRDAGVPLEAVLRGIDDAFDRHDARAGKAGKRLRRVNGLAWAAQAVMLATDAMKAAAVGMPAAVPRESGLEAVAIQRYLSANADRIEQAALPDPIRHPSMEIVSRLRTLASTEPADTEGLERSLSVLEEKLFALLLLATPEHLQIEWREQAQRGLAGSRGMAPAQLKSVTQQFLNKRLLERHGLKRLSLFYMEHL